MAKLLSIAWRLGLLLCATALYLWACFEYVFRRTYGRALADQELTEKQMSAVVEVMTRPTERVFVVATVLYLLLAGVIVGLWAFGATEREEGE